MPKDVIVVVNIDAKPRASEALDILLISTAGAKDIATYRSLDEVRAAFPDVAGKPQRIYNKCAAMFNQGKTTLAETLIRKVKIVGFPALTGETDKAKATDLIDKIKTLQETDNDWYILLTDRDEDDIVTALAKFAEDSEPTEAELGAGIEDHRKFYFGQTDNLALVGGYRRSAIIYSDTLHLDEEADAAYLGNVGPFYPVSVTWKFKRPQGITMPDITDAQREALEEANINFLTEEYKRQYVKNGTCWDGEFIDVQMGADYIAHRMRSELYDVFLQNAKVPYTDAGFALVAAAVFASLNKAVSLGVIARDPESGAGIYNVVVPKRSQATDDQARARQMPDVVWEALLEGAVHSVKVKGTLRASLSA
ncbi:DUF3383 family protein [Desulfitobacterium sp.]|uniref:DUF3383 family protein n=1 Tax=Desulfitobacterium sp. TaxID=49981 RepID=UPI002B217FD0|nr:DUF3383 family protein [Desulfitobacterium sp.]MEA4901855.1 DUF3383 family protein [Desulfitobacterium sp.]